MKVEHLHEIPVEFFESPAAMTSGLLAEWHALAADAPTCDSDWLLSWWLHFGPAGQHRTAAPAAKSMAYPVASV